MNIKRGTLVKFSSYAHYAGKNNSNLNTRRKSPLPENLAAETLPIVTQLKAVTNINFANHDAAMYLEQIWRWVFY